MASDKEVKFTKVDIKLFTKEHENAKNAKRKKESPRDLKLYKHFLQRKQKERYSGYSILATELQFAFDSLR